jgi:ankyrin repeat protein
MNVSLCFEKLRRFDMETLVSVSIVSVVAVILIFAVRHYLASYEGNIETFFRAVAEGKSEIVERMLVEKPGLAKKADKMGRTALHWAIDYNRCDIMSVLVEHGANINATTKDKMNPLHLAAQNNRKEMAEFLLSKGADHTARSNFGRTPLMLASKLHHTSVEGVLRSYGARE